DMFDNCTDNVREQIIPVNLSVRDRTWLGISCPVQQRKRSFATISIRNLKEEPLVLENFTSFAKLLFLLDAAINAFALTSGFRFYFEYQKVINNIKCDKNDPTNHIQALGEQTSREESEGSYPGLFRVILAIVFFEDCQAIVIFDDCQVIVIFDDCQARRDVILRVVRSSQSLDRADPYLSLSPLKPISILPIQYRLPKEVQKMFPRCLSDKVCVLHGWFLLLFYKVEEEGSMSIGTIGFSRDKSSPISFTNIAGQIAGSIGVSIYMLHRTLCVAPSAHTGNHRHASDGARHMPAGDSTTVTIICETISGNESCAACAGSGSKRRKSILSVESSKAYGPPSEVLLKTTRILHHALVYCAGFENSLRFLDHHFGYENNEVENRESCQAQSTSAMSFHQAGVDSFFALVNLLDQCHFSEQNAMFKSALFLSRDTYRASLPSRWLLDFSEPDQGVPGKPRTLLVLLSESASRDGQSASIDLAEIQDRDVTMVTAPFDY
ncbi:hypothetical protein G5I_07434, partial [Acromyrmex echinatior]